MYFIIWTDVTSYFISKPPSIATKLTRETQRSMKLTNNAVLKGGKIVI